MPRLAAAAFYPPMCACFFVFLNPKQMEKFLCVSVCVPKTTMEVAEMVGVDVVRSTVGTSSAR